MKTLSTQVIELLALGEAPGGGYYIKIGVTQQDEQASYTMDIDEFTYVRLAGLPPLNGARVRISPYPKWNPYRTTYYCALIRMTNDTRMKLDFECSERFIAQLDRLRHMPPPYLPDEGMRPEQEEREEERTEARHARRVPARKARAALRLLIISALLVIVCFRLEAGWLTEGAMALSGHFSHKAAEPVLDPVEEVPPQAVAMAALDGNSSDALVSQAVHAVAAPDQRQQREEPAPPSPPAAAPKEYEVITIDEGHGLYGLPKGYVALSFDDGPSQYTKRIIDILKENNVAATFLFVGKNVVRNPDAVTYAYEQGMSIGNHSWDHSVLTKAAPEERINNIAKTNKALEALTHTPVTLFRPPYGAVDQQLKATVKELPMKLLMWNRDPEDWHAKKPEDIVRYFREVDSSGGVYVMHEDKVTVEALPEIIEVLKGNHLKFVIFH
ncbi:polysaccharide deacetylase family protein [Paenibacillus sp. GD4]|jgi:peptidoglycan-N-acetylglucosamine deacetylase|uniref:polysaccharide deacetylase family protein n=1 Tax=Paenibacillus sp. GD4 TaxID=3068890 RepID=UPI002796E195|nr:polysaccharide deacetylase family protein [Paenibacillus sp. GD4]MDQ1911129.1 polysaccharide deacetylase family protein [Paenibacillus sp. GD4]